MNHPTISSRAEEEDQRATTGRKKALLQVAAAHDHALPSASSSSSSSEPAHAAAMNCNIWASLPRDLLMYGVLSKLHIKDRLRLRAVNRSWNAAIPSLFISSELTPPLHLPWFYCMVQLADEAEAQPAYDPPRRAVAFDPAMKTWHWQLPLPPALQAHLRKSRARAAAGYLYSDERVWWYRPVVSSGSLVCWEYSAGISPRGRRHPLMLSKTFTNVCQEVDAPQHLEPVQHASGWRCVRLERRGRSHDDETDGINHAGSTNNISLIFICLTDELLGVIRIERYDYGGAAAAAAGSTVLAGPPVQVVNSYVEKSLQCLYQNGSPQRTIPLPVYYHEGTLAFLQWQPRALNLHRLNHKLPDLLVFGGNGNDKVVATGCRIAMPTFSKSLNVMVKASYEMVQMDAELLLLVFKRKPTFKVRQVFVYKYNFAEQGWSLLSNNLTFSLGEDYVPGRGRHLNVCCAARAGLLMLSVHRKAYICHLKTTPHQSSTWQSVPPCCASVGGPSLLIKEVACPFDPSLC